MHVLNALLLGWSLAPLVLMLGALFYAAWTRESRESEAVAAPLPRNELD